MVESIQMRNNNKKADSFESAFLLLVNSVL